MAADKSLVSIRNCPDYADCYDSIKTALSDISFLSLFNGKRVLLKVNLVTARPPEEAINTHPEFVRGVIRVIQENGGIALIGESSGTLGFTKEAFEVSGISRVALETGAKILNFDTSGARKHIIGGKILKEAYLPDAIFDADIKITLPKLKTHDFMLLSGALKNQMGALPGSYKCRMHQLAPTPPAMAELISELNLYLKFDLAIVDGVISMEGNGPVFGRAKRTSFIMAGRDLVAVDAVCSAIIGFKPEVVLTNKIGEKLGLGNADLSNIDLVGDTGGNRRPGSFMLPAAPSKLKVLFLGLKYFLKSIAVMPVALQNKCNACGLCEKKCPVQAIAIDGFPRINIKRCIRCYNCFNICPNGAIRLKCKWYLKYFFKKSSRGMRLEGMV